MIKNITPQEAHAFLQANPDAILLDVRTTMEFEYIGHPLGAVHVPLMEAPAWTTDPDFVEKVGEKLRGENAPDPKQRPILALCRSGKRSEAAANQLIEAGYQTVYNIVEGFEGDRDDNKHRGTINGWRFHQLPWEQN